MKNLHKLLRKPAFLYRYVFRKNILLKIEKLNDIKYIYIASLRKTSLPHSRFKKMRDISCIDISKAKNRDSIERIANNFHMQLAYYRVWFRQTTSS